MTQLATNTTLNSKINEVKSKIPTITNLVTNVSLNAKINKVQNRMPIITNLVTTNTPTTLILLKLNNLIIVNISLLQN